MAIRFSSNVLVDTHKLCKNIEEIFDMGNHDVKMDVENYNGKILDMDLDVPDIDTSDFDDSE